MSKATPMVETRGKTASRASNNSSSNLRVVDLKINSASLPSLEIVIASKTATFHMISVSSLASIFMELECAKCTSANSSTNA